MFVYQSIVVYDIMLLVTRFSRCGACQLLHLLQDSVRKYGVPGNTAWKAEGKEGQLG